MDNPEASELVDDTTVSSECTLDVATDPNASQISRARYVAIYGILYKFYLACETIWCKCGKYQL